MDKPPSLVGLQAFDATVRHMSFTKSAEELNLTQSAVSKQIARLEFSLGIKLFERKIRSLVLTDAGLAFHHKVSPALDSLNEAIREAQNVENSAVITISMPPTFSAQLGMYYITRFQLEHPHIDVRISLNNSGIILKQRDIEFAIEYIHHGTRLPDHNLLFEEKLIPVCSPEYFDKLRNTSEENALENALLLHCNQHEGSYTDWSGWLRSFGRSDVYCKKGSVFDTLQLAFDAAIQGTGIALSEQRFANQYLEQGSLVIPFDHIFFSGRGYYSRIANNSQARAQVQELADWIATMFE